ncbi:MAG: hypothetical protein GY839_15880 [candidate division Zixibacteria bacterium]|nr:hypothetical protein [candidate division Zixibacteria bacterium]
MNNTKKTAIILLHAFVGWALCGAIMGIGMSFTSELNAQIIHAIGAPIIFYFISLSYFRKFNYTSPLLTAFIIVCFALFMDVFVVSLLILKNFAMFESILGVWIPMACMFLTVNLTGLFINRAR